MVSPFKEVVQPRWVVITISVYQKGNTLSLEDEKARDPKLIEHMVVAVHGDGTPVHLG
jgi:hypothetical protein